MEKDSLPDQLDRDNWPAMRDKLRALFKQKTRDEWCAILEGTDVCFAPVLSMGEAPDHPHMKARDTFIEIDGVVQPAPAPRFSRTELEVQCPPPQPGADTAAGLEDWGLSRQDVASLLESGAVWQRD